MRAIPVITHTYILAQQYHCVLVNPDNPLSIEFITCCLGPTPDNVSPSFIVRVLKEHITVGCCA